MFQFGSPQYFALLLLPLALAYPMLVRGYRGAVLFSSVSRIPAGRPTWRIVVAAALPWLFLAGLVLLVVAMARPQKVFSHVNREANAIAIEIVMDVSGSMVALDFSKGREEKSRLDVVKETFEKFVDMRPEDLIGLVTFAGYATSRAPLTIDHDVLKQILATVELPKERFDKNRNVVNQEDLLTAIGDGLAAALARLKDSEIASKIVVLLSDGESNAGVVSPEQAAAAAKALGIKVYTIGVGSTGFAKVKAYRHGRLETMQMRVTLDEAQLKRIAATTGGHYFNVRDPEALDNAVKQIDELEKTSIRDEMYNQYDELYAPFLIAGIVLILLAGTAKIGLTGDMA